MEGIRGFDGFISERGGDLAELDKKRVLEECRGRLSDPVDVINGFRFLFTRYSGYLEVQDVDSLFQVYLPAFIQYTVSTCKGLTSHSFLTHDLHSPFQDQPAALCDTIDLITLAFKNTARDVGCPETHLGFKNLYSRTLELVQKSYNVW